MALVDSVDSAGLGTVTLSNAADTSSSTTDDVGPGFGSDEGAGIFGSVSAGARSAAWEGIGAETGSASCEGTCSASGAETEGAEASREVSASASRPWRERPNAFRRRVRMPMCATLRMS